MKFVDLQSRPTGLLKGPAPTENVEPVVLRKKACAHSFESANVFSGGAPVNICSIYVGFANVDVKQRLRFLLRLEERLGRENLLQLPGRSLAVGRLQLRGFQQCDCKFAAPKILQTAIRMKIDCAKLGKMVRRLAARENSGAVDRHSASRNR